MTFARVSWSEKPMTAVTTADVATMPVTSTWWTEKSQIRRATNESPTARSRAMRGTPHPGPGQEQVEDDDGGEAEEGDPLQEEGDEEDGGRRARELEEGEGSDAAEEHGDAEHEDEPYEAAPRFAHADEEERRPQEEGGPEPDRFRREDGKGAGSGHGSGGPR